MSPSNHLVFVSSRIRPWAIWVMTASLCLLAGCESTGSKVDANSFPLPPVYHNTVGPQISSRATEAFTGNWWTQYGSEELNRLVDRGLAHNSELRVATLQVAQAKIRADQARAGRLPTITAPVRALVQNHGGNTDSQQNSQVTLAGSFRVDVWGEQRALVDSADMQLERAVHERENVQRNTIGSLVNAYIAFLSVSDSMLIARENEVIATEILRTVERRISLGDATAEDLEQQRAVLFSQQVVLPGLENQQEDLRSAISRLVGALPSNLILSEKGLDALRVPTFQAGLPSELLLGRPDIRMMEARMRAANANIEVARARLLPSIDLTSQMGYNGATLATLLQPQNFLANTAAALALSIFDGGVKRGEQAFAQSYYEEMAVTYGRTVLQAMREVESALSSVNTSSRRLEAQRNVTRSALNIFKIASEAYAAGAIDQTAMLESRKNYQRSADETQRVKADVSRSHATLAYALGLGSVIADGSPNGRASGDQKSDLSQSLRVGHSDGVSTLQNLGSTQPHSERSCEVALPGVYHRSSLLPLWRDLGARVAIDGRESWLRAEHLDHIDGMSESSEAWYRVSVCGFVNRDAAMAYCDALLHAGQGCKLGEAAKVAVSKLIQ